MDWITIRLILVVVFTAVGIKNALLGNFFFENERVLSKKMKHYRLMVFLVGCCVFLDVLCMTYLIVYQIEDVLRIMFLSGMVAVSFWVAHVIKYKMIYKLNERN